MFRAGTARQLRALSGLAASAPRSSQFSSKLCALSQITRPLAVGKPMTLAMARYATQPSAMDKINKEVESKLGEQKLKADPDTVSTTSSTHPVFGEVGMAEDPHKDADMMAGVKNDLVSLECRHSSCNSMLIFDPENHQGYLLARGRPSSSLHPGNGWCTSLPRNLAFHSLLRLGNQPCTQHRLWILDERANC